MTAEIKPRDLAPRRLHSWEHGDWPQGGCCVAAGLGTLGHGRCRRVGRDAWCPSTLILDQLNLAREGPAAAALLARKCPTHTLNVAQAVPERSHKWGKAAQWAQRQDESGLWLRSSMQRPASAVTRGGDLSPALWHSCPQIDWLQAADFPRGRSTHIYSGGPVPPAPAHICPDVSARLPLGVGTGR